jgi:hypothetical protein
MTTSRSLNAMAKSRPAIDGARETPAGCGERGAMGSAAERHVARTRRFGVDR